MADQLFLSYNLRGFTEANMLRHFEKVVRKFPFSKLSKGGLNLRITAVSFAEPTLLEQAFEPGDLDGPLAATREHNTADCAVQMEGYWDLWQYEKDWKLTPTRVILTAFGPGFEDSDGEHIRIDLGLDTHFLPQEDLPNHLFMARSNIRACCIS